VLCPLLVQLDTAVCLRSTTNVHGGPELVFVISHQTVGRTHVPLEPFKRTIGCWLHRCWHHPLAVGLNFGGHKGRWSLLMLRSVCEIDQDYSSSVVTPSTVPIYRPWNHWSSTMGNRRLDGASRSAASHQEFEQADPFPEIDQMHKYFKSTFLKQASVQELFSAEPSSRLDCLVACYLSGAL
jgi:hypothetical protein